MATFIDGLPCDDGDPCTAGDLCQSGGCAGGTATPPCAGNCCAASSVTGCSDAPVSECVCARDAFCCEVAWDALCAAQIALLGCGTCPCGDEVCAPHLGESCSSCPSDCGECHCGDGSCDAQAGEGCGKCPEDCGACPCGDGVCSAADGESCAICALDCGSCPCGDGQCDPGAGETCATCPDDCLPCDCGDGECATSSGESCTSCASDCGPCEESCCIAHDSAGCNEPSTTAAVCAIDLTCCSEAWDAHCVALAESAPGAGCPCELADGCEPLCDDCGWTVSNIFGSFESTWTGSTPAAWFPHIAAGAPTLEWTDAQAKTGALSLHVANSGTGRGSWYRPPVAVIPGAQYELRVWVRRENALDPPHFDVKFHSDPSTPLFNNGPFGDFHGSPDEGGWQLFRGTFVVPSTAHFAQLFIAHAVNVGGDEVQKLWFDDFGVREHITLLAEKVLANILDMPLSTSAPTPSLVAQALLLESEATVATDALAEGEYADAGSRALLLDQMLSLSSQHWALQRASLLRKAANLMKELFPKASPGMVIGWLDSMSRVFLDSVPTALDVTKNAVLPMFPGEYEAIQLVVFADGTALDDVKVALDADLPGWDVDIRVVGYVHDATARWIDDTHQHQGWWPDPLLELDSMPLEAEQTGAFWIRCRAPHGTNPGLYPIELTVSATSQNPITVTLWILVWEPELPDTWYLKRVFGFAGPSGTGDIAAAYGPDVALDGPELSAFHDQLIDQRFGLASIHQWYPLKQFPKAALLKAAAAGQNTFVATSLAGGPFSDGDVVAGFPDLSAKDESHIDQLLDTDLAWLAEYGLLDKAMVYAFDEVNVEYFDIAEAVFAALKFQAGIRTASTIKQWDYSMLGGQLDTLIAYRSRYDYHKAAAVRESGREVWLYTASTPTNAQPGALRRELLDVFRQSADGFLIWKINHWGGNSGPYVASFRNADWVASDAVEFTRGVLLYPGVDGPVGSIRFENIRDGLEDCDMLAHAAERLMVAEGLASRHQARRKVAHLLGLPEDPRAMDDVAVRELRRRLARMLVDASWPVLNDPEE